MRRANRPIAARSVKFTRTNHRSGRSGACSLCNMALLANAVADLLQKRTSKLCNAPTSSSDQEEPMLAKRLCSPSSTPAHSVHAGNIWLGHEPKDTEPLALADLPPDVISQIAESIATAALLAQCSPSLLRLLRHRLLSLVRFQEMGTIRVSLPHRGWYRQAAAIGEHLYLLCDGATTSVLLGCHFPKAAPAAHNSAALLSPAWATDGRWGDCCGVASMAQPAAAATHESTLIVCDRVAGVSILSLTGTPIRSFRCPSVSQPSAVATDGEHVFTSGGGWLHRFVLATGICSACWPLNPGAGCLSGDHGMAPLLM